MNTDDIEYIKGKFRFFKLGHRRVGGMLVPRGWPLEELIDGEWIHVDTFPPDRNCIISRINYGLKQTQQSIAS